MLGRSGMNRIIAVLVMLLMGSSWQIITHQHEIRKLNIALEKEKNRYSDLKLEYHRLELQNSKDAATDHVESIAREKEEAEAAKKAGKIAKTTTPVDSTKTDTKKEEVKANSEKTESVKKEVKIEDKSINKSDVKPATKTESTKLDSKESKVEAKPKSDIKATAKVDTPKAVTKKADPMEDQLGEFLKKHESKSKN